MERSAGAHLHTAHDRVRDLHDLCKGFAQPARSQAAARLSASAQGCRCLVVHAVLWCDLRRLFRPYLFAQHLLHRSVRLSTIVAGYCTAACVFAGSLVRPLGGAFADSFGGITTLSLVYTVAAAALVAISAGPSTVALALVLFVIAMLALGIGNGAVFQLVPQRFHREIDRKSTRLNSSH